MPELAPRTSLTIASACAGTLPAVSIFWNDVEILRLVYACEHGERGGAHGGIELAQTLAADRGVGLGNGDDARLVSELLALNEADLLRWQVLSSIGRVQPISPTNANDYLNNIRDFALTIAGRDRALGQVIRVLMPDPNDDDGRPFRALTLKDIAAIIGAEYSPVEAIQMLADSGVSPEGFEFGGVVWEGPSVVGHVLDALAHGTSERRRELRRFIGAWLDDELHHGPTEDQRKGIERDLARQGWFVTDGCLVIGEPVRRNRDAPEVPKPDTAQLHPTVWDAAAPQWAAHHLHDAVRAAAAAVNAMLQRKVSRDDISESELVRQAFSKNAPMNGRARLRFPFIQAAKTRESMTQGALSFGLGCFQAIRNPIGHLPDHEYRMTEQEALEQLAAWSLLARWIALATVTTPDD
ncbi:MAG: TIGR02391 family protein [Solirubrobacteraceae bacterium]